MGEWIPSRYVVVFMTMVGLVVIYPQRGNLSVAIVAMVKPGERENGTAEASNNTFVRADMCPITSFKNHSADYETNTNGEFHWSQTTQGFILGGFFYGYVATQALGGRMSDMFGAKLVFAFGVMVSSIMSLLTPLAARWNVVALIVVRIIMGLAQSVNIPAVFTLMTKWVPPNEKGIMLSGALVGAHLGNIIVMPITGYLCDNMILGGWPATFYIFGSVGFIWFGFWWFLVYDSPSQHPRISDKEIMFLNQHVEHEEQRKTKNDREKVPWVHLLTSPAVLSLAWAKLALAWNYNGMLTKLPSYLESVLHFEIQDNSYINSMMYGAAGISLLFSGYLADLIIKHSHLSVGFWRKTFQGLASFGTSLCLFLIPVVRCNDTVVVILLIVNMAFYGLIAGGEQSNGVELAPKYSGLISGICNSFASISGFLTPIIAGVFVEGNEDSTAKWSYFFYISGALSATGGLAFVAFSSSSVQSWAEPSKQDEMERNAPKKTENGAVNMGFVEKY